MKAIPNPQSYKSLLLQGNWFSHIPSELADALLAVADVVSFSAGQSVFLYGDPKQGLYGVVSGVISIDRQREDGKEALLALVEAPNWFGEITLFDRQQRTHNARAITDSTLVHISGDALNTLLTAQPQYWQYLGLLLTSKVRLLMDIAEDLALRSTAQRVAKRLVLIAESYGSLKSHSRRIIEVPQEQLAMMLFMTRQTINQILKDLARQQLIKLNYGAIEILDLEALRLFANHISSFNSD
jgi:CRP/FNR family transcriptional regulator, cyclic AMP receptor protein